MLICRATPASHAPRLALTRDLQMWRACSTPAPASNKFCIFTKVLHLSEVHRRSELSHLSEVRSRQSTTSYNKFCGPSIEPQMPEVFHVCFVGMNKSMVYFSLEFIHVVRMFVVALSLHLSRGRLCLRVHCLIDGILLFCVHTHLAFFFYIVAYCLCSRCRCTIHSVRLPHVSACPFLFCGPSIKPQMPEVFHICFVGMNKSTVYFSLAFIHVVRMFVVALSLHLSRGRPVSACALSDRRYIALLCSYTFSVLLLHRCVLFVFPLSLYHSQRTSTPRFCMSISVGNRTDGIFLFCIETHRSVLFVVTPSSCCPYNVQA